MPETVPDRILARMRRLSDQGRRPELTASDAAYAVGMPRDEVVRILEHMVRNGLLRSSYERSRKDVAIYRPADA